MTNGIQDAAGPLGMIGAVLLCLPYLLPVIAVFVVVGAFSAFGGWLGDNAAVTALGAVRALAAATLVAYAFWIGRQRGAASGSADAVAL